MLLYMSFMKSLDLITRGQFKVSFLGGGFYYCELPSWFHTFGCQEHRFSRQFVTKHWSGVYKAALIFDGCICTDPQGTGYRETK
jgi:hypothetical protein